jgi:N-acetylglucosaminyl-diphospho-decaprenol L-rhamnosyltransferase
MAEEPRRLEAVIVSYECRELVIACLDSLRRHPLRRGRMIVRLVDNASGDGTVDEVRDRYPEVDVIALERNVGFSAANNLVLRSARSPYVLLLNPDTEATEGALDHMLDVLESRPDVGMAGCRLVRPDGSFDHAAKRSFPTPLSALAHFAGLGRRVERGALAGYRAPEVGERDAGEVDAVNGAFMLVRRSAVEEVGLLDEGYWLYMEDLDWCYRFGQAGWKVLYDGRVTFVHVKGGAAGTYRRPRQNIAFHRGMGRFYRKFHAGRRPLGAPVVYAGISAKLALSLARSALARRLAVFGRMA